MLLVWILKHVDFAVFNKVDNWIWFCDQLKASFSRVLTSPRQWLYDSLRAGISWFCFCFTVFNWNLCKLSLISQVTTTIMLRSLSAAIKLNQNRIKLSIKRTSDFVNENLMAAQGEPPKRHKNWIRRNWISILRLKRPWNLKLRTFSLERENFRK